METRLHQFCHDFDAILSPLGEPVREVVDVLGEKAAGLAVRGELPSLRDTHHKLELLTEKIRRQQAYVLIFGPLKSGKSTLMNAITGRYVSEVSALPAYPCLVYVSDSDTPEFVATHYDGSPVELADSAALRQCIKDAHGQLSDRIREYEAARNGDASAEEFDPAVHFPQAIRKIDVRIPAGDLEKSGAVLVDTPGLYSRMKFGYDRMTRDFRDTAACAVFVVKTDNLFLEQVFEEFQDLLNLFDRIFLVVNLDSEKKDLCPDGSLVPSLEHDDPRQVIGAFEKLAMSAPLKKASDEGRLRIYPVDLLRAASRRLQTAIGKPVESAPPMEVETTEGTGDPAETTGMVEQPPDAPPEPASPGENDPPEDKAADAPESPETGDGPAPPEPHVVAEAAPPPDDADPPDGFEVLRRDMTDYLNSSDYITAFMNDSLRYAENLLGTLGAFRETPAVREIDRTKAEEEEAIADGEKLKEALERIVGETKTDDQRVALLQELKSLHQKSTEEALEKVTSRVVSDVPTLVRQWFESDESLQQLSAERVHPLAASAIKSRTGDAVNALESLTRNERLPLAGELREDLAHASIDPEAAVAETLDAIDLPPLADCEVAAPFAGIPVKRRFIDWLLFRTPTALRKRLFGSKDEPVRPLTASEKRGRLGETAQEKLEEFYTGSLSKSLTEKLRQRANIGWEQFAAGFFGRVARRVEVSINRNNGQLTQSREKVRLLTDVTRTIEMLTAAVATSADAAEAIRARFDLNKLPGLPIDDGGQSPEVPEPVGEPGGIPG